MTNPVVHIENFRMDFGRTTVVKDLSFDVYPGETFGFLGSNGSGKTTTIRALLGIYEATAGTLHVNGAPFSPERSGKLGYLPEERGLYKKESVIDVMAYFGRLKGLDKKRAIQWSMNYLERVELADRAKVRLDKLSSGQQQKVQLGVTLMNDPVLLILDEPTKGFDPVNRKLLMDIIDEQKKLGATVLMVTHQMEEVERLCDRVILLKNGVAHAYGTIEEVQSKFGEEIIYVQTKDAIPHSTLYTVRDQQSGVAQLVALPSVQPADILASLLAAGISVDAFQPKKPSLDDIFLEVYGPQGREGVA
jgi:ABC-2 type transport system ATP-binding protein